MKFKVNHNKNGESYLTMMDKPTDIIFDLENKLIRANKRIIKWRKEAKRWHQNYENSEFISDAISESAKRWQESYWNIKLKQKKAWTAFYIATILYIVGILILI